MNKSALNYTSPTNIIFVADYGGFFEVNPMASVKCMPSNGTVGSTGSACIFMLSDTNIKVPTSFTHIDLVAIKTGNYIDASILCVPVVGVTD